MVIGLIKTAFAQNKMEKAKTDYALRDRMEQDMRHAKCVVFCTLSPLSSWGAAGESHERVLRGADKKKIHIPIAVSKSPDKTTARKKSVR